ncbi:Fic family protein [uncultured Corynebacterium sp.]|uniref:Fic/DOC family protein n=1 Tax=uncultured Corynebacterium sp. TaxID=159447 RepID=UPI0025EC15DC|nr:Fic family protein [uncultured Corynebacterium sp.]
MAPSERESLQWVAYFYPETYDPATRNGVLKNNFGERNQETLTEIEYAATVRRSQELRDNPQLVKHTYDSEHLKAIHQHLFQDVYPWAGEYRLVNMQKGPVPFADHSDEIDEYMRSVQRQVAETDWNNLDRKGFVSAVSAVFADLNQAHPFREGNGRASREFLHHVSEQSQYSLDFGRVSAAAWNQASMLSSPDLGSTITHPDELHEVFRAMAVARPEVKVSKERKLADRVRQQTRGYKPKNHAKTWDQDNQVAQRYRRL